MIIEIDETFHLEDDNLQYILKQETGRSNDKGEPVYKTIGYYTDIGTALERLARNNVRSKNESITLGKYIEEIKQELQSFKKAAGLS